MIHVEEENIEDFLKSITPWKGILKGFFVVLFLVTAYIIITYFPDWFIMAILFICVSVILMIPQLSDQVIQRQTLSVLNCENKECGTQDKIIKCRNKKQVPVGFLLT